MAPRARRQSAPWVACSSCGRASWVYVHYGIKDCNRCGRQFPPPPQEQQPPWRVPSATVVGSRSFAQALVEGPPAGHGRQGRKQQADGVAEAWKALAVQLGSDLPAEAAKAVEEALAKLAPEAKPKQKSEGAAVQEASAAVNAALRARRQAADRRDKARRQIEEAWKAMQQLHSELPVLEAAVVEADKEVQKATEEQSRIVAEIAGVTKAEEQPTPPPPTTAVPGRRLGQLEAANAALRKQVEELKALLGPAAPASPAALAQAHVQPAVQDEVEKGGLAQQGEDDIKMAEEEAKKRALQTKAEKDDEPDGSQGGLPKLPRLAAPTARHEGEKETADAADKADDVMVGEGAAVLDIDGIIEQARCMAEEVKKIPHKATVVIQSLG